MTPRDPARTYECPRGTTSGSAAGRLRILNPEMARDDLRRLAAPPSPLADWDHIVVAVTYPSPRAAVSVQRKHLSGQGVLDGI